MDRWQNKVAVVTGASSGIGAAVAADLVKAGFVVAALARREERLQSNKAALPTNLQSRYHPIKCDVSKDDQVKQAFAWVEENLGGTDVLINNAGISLDGLYLTDPESASDMRAQVDTNILAVVYCVREAFNSMKKRNFDGHIVIMNSIDGHKVPYMPGMSFNIYPATKFAVTAMTETYRQEFANAGTKVKVTSISPGAVETEIFTDWEAFKADGHPFLNVEDISNAIMYVLSTPPHVQVISNRKVSNKVFLISMNFQIHELMIKPVGEKF